MGADWDESIPEVLVLVAISLKCLLLVRESHSYNL